MLAPIILGMVLAGQAIENGDFEQKPGRDGSIPGWEVSVGAMNGATEPLSTVEIDRGTKHGGRSSLMFSGDDTTRAWRIAKQRIAVRPGGLYRLTGHARTKDVRQETVRGTAIRQFTNCYIMVLFLDGTGELVARKVEMPRLPTSDWHEIRMEVKAPDTARQAWIYLFLSMSGTLWIDDLGLEITGGKELPPLEIIMKEGFEKASRIPREWQEELGARNGDGRTRNKIQIDRKAGCPGSPRSVVFSGQASTIQWYGLSHRFPAEPGDAVRFGCQVRAEDVRKEGIQFPNLHIRLVFFDKEGEIVGPARYGDPGDGTFDWKPVEALGVVPEGASEVLAGIFLSMSGKAWFDEIEITKQPGSQPAYHDWRSLETKHLLLRFPGDHPRADTMADYGNRLVEVFESICEQLGVTYDERITMFIYKDGTQGKNLTGRELDFADPEGRAVHQTMQSTLGHEMVHVIALRLGYAQTGLLGEGIAVYLNGAKPEEHHRRAAKLLKEGGLPGVQAMLDSFRDQENSYPAAGSFCGYLIETYGIESFKKLYPLTDPSSSAQRILGEPLEVIEQNWIAFLRGQ